MTIKLGRLNPTDADRVPLRRLFSRRQVSPDRHQEKRHAANPRHSDPVRLDPAKSRPIIQSDVRRVDVECSPSSRPGTRYAGCHRRGNGSRSQSIVIKTRQSTSPPQPTQAKRLRSVATQRSHDARVIRMPARRPFCCEKSPAESVEPANGRLPHAPTKHRYPAVPLVALEKLDLGSPEPGSKPTRDLVAKGSSASAAIRANEFR